MNKVHPLVKYVRSELKRAANPEKAAPMQAYMKTDQPFYGVQGTPRKQIYKTGIKKHPVQSRDEYHAIIWDLWNGKYREEMYMALEVAEQCKAFRGKASWSLYEKLMRSATNWDTLDWIVGRIMSPIVQEHRQLEEKLIKWRVHKNFWVRRASLLAHLKHKDQTNVELLAETILLLAHEDEFFIRKAIGWILREYSYTDAKWVEAFVAKHEDVLSTLSKREALKAIERERKK